MLKDRLSRNKKQQQKAAKEYGGYTNATYSSVSGLKSSYSPPASQAKATSIVTTKNGSAQ